MQCAVYWPLHFILCPAKTPAHVSLFQLMASLIFNNHMVFMVYAMFTPWFKFFKLY